MQGLKAVNFPDSQYDHHQVSQVADFREHSRLEARRIVKARQHSRWTNARCHILHCCSCVSIDSVSPYIECTGMNTRHTCIIILSTKALTLQLLCDNLQVYRSVMESNGK